MRRRIVENPRDLGRAEKIRQTFVDRPVEEVYPIRWEWPRKLQYVGSCLAVMYASDKWQKKRGEMQDYKHVAESPQRLYVRPGWIEPYPQHRTRVGETGGPMVPMGSGLPDAIAELATCLGLHARLLRASEDGWVEPRGDEGVVQIDVGGCLLGGATTTAGQPFLCVYDQDELFAVVTGEELDIEKDGIVG